LASTITPVIIRLNEIMIAVIIDAFLIFHLHGYLFF